MYVRLTESQHPNSDTVKSPNEAHFSEPKVTSEVYSRDTAPFPCPMCFPARINEAFVIPQEFFEKICHKFFNASDLKRVILAINVCNCLANCYKIIGNFKREEIRSIKRF